MDWADAVLETCMEKVKHNIDLIGETFPHVSLNGYYNCEKPEFWTAGFWPGILWLYYLTKGDWRAKDLAVSLEERLDQVMEDFEGLHHDVGFMWLPTAVLHNRIEKNPKSRRRGLKAASLLAGRFNPSGNFIRAWNDDVRPNSQGIAIIDCLMNLPLLYWASEEMKDCRFRNIAIRHTDMVVEHFLRADDTVPHIVCFLPETGEKLENLAGQGKSPDSIWSRGQSWALYGFAVAGRETKDHRYLEISRRIADKVIALLGDETAPCWDYCATGIEREAKDTSAASCAASGMLLLSEQLEDVAEKEYYRLKAEWIVRGLCEQYVDFSDKEQGILRNGTVSYPDGRHINVPIIYGDYFLIEALMRLTGLEVTVF